MAGLCCCRRSFRNRGQPSSLSSKPLSQLRRNPPSRTRWNWTSTKSTSLSPTLHFPPLLPLLLLRRSFPLRHRLPLPPASSPTPPLFTTPATLPSSHPPLPLQDTPSSRPTTSSHAASPTEQSSLTTSTSTNLTASTGPDRALPTTRTLLNVLDRLRTKEQEKEEKGGGREESTTRRRSGLLPTSENGHLPLEILLRSLSETTLSKEKLARNLSLEGSSNGRSSAKLSRKPKEERTSATRTGTPRQLFRSKSPTTRELPLHLPPHPPFDTRSSPTVRLPPRPSKTQRELPPLSSSPRQTRSTMDHLSTRALPPPPPRSTPKPPSSQARFSVLALPNRTTNERNETTPPPPRLLSQLPLFQLRPSPTVSDTPEPLLPCNPNHLSPSLLLPVPTCLLRWQQEVPTVPSLGIEEALSRPTKE